MFKKSSVLCAFLVCLTVNILLLEFSDFTHVVHQKLVASWNVGAVAYVVCFLAEWRTPGFLSPRLVINLQLVPEFLQISSRTTTVGLGSPSSNR
jgi:hypothetical protein